MRTLGFIATGVAIVVVAAASVALLMSLPDIRRYLRIRSM
jgi:uncharacterized protein DUF6893